MAGKRDVEGNRSTHAQAAILTSHAEAQPLLVEELHRAGLVSSPLSDELLMVEGEDSPATLRELAERGLLAFARHIAPVQHRISRAAPPRDLEEVVCSILPPTPASALSLHVRSLQGALSREERHLLRAEIESAIAVRGHQIVRAAPESIISMIVTPEWGFIGVDTVENSLSSWPGGEIRLKVEGEPISRAEYKLLEVEICAGLQFGCTMRALDLGAAPGGWTRVLATRGVQVTAVDPAELDLRCRSLSGVVHHPLTAQEYRARHQGEHFDLLLNDMRMDPLESARLMGEMASMLRPAGRGVMTLKLPRADPREVLTLCEQALSILRRRYEVLFLRQLFHNRSEVTAVLSPRISIP